MPRGASYSGGQPMHTAVAVMKTWLDDWLDTLLLVTAIASLTVLLTMIL